MLSKESQSQKSNYIYIKYKQAKFTYMVRSLDSDCIWGEVITGLGWGLCSDIWSGWWFNGLSVKIQRATHLWEVHFSECIKTPRKSKKWTLAYHSRASLMWSFDSLLESTIPFKVAFINNILFSNAPWEERGAKCFKLGGLNKLSLIYL